MTDTCYHCGKEPEADGDHTCPCPYPDGLCPVHDQCPDEPEIMEVPD